MKKKPAKPKMTGIASVDRVLEHAKQRFKLQAEIGQNPRRIPKSFFSEKFRNLPIKEKIEIRRKLQQKSLELNLKTKNAADELKKFGLKLRKLSQNPKNANIQELKKTRQDFSRTRDNLFEELDAFVKNASPYFNDFHPFSGEKHHGQNHIESISHKTMRLLGEYEKYFKVIDIYLSTFEEAKKRR